MLLKQLLLLNDLRPYTSFREAASALQMPESTLRTAIHQLEDELGCTLLLTNQRGIHWTPVAEQLWPHTESIAKKTHALYRLPDLLSEVFSQRIAIASGSHFGSLLLTELMAEILAEYPNAQFSLATLDNQTLLQQLVAQKIDFALLRIHAVEAPLLNPALQSLPLDTTPLYNDHMCFLVGPCHPLYNRTSASFHEILESSRLISKDKTDPLTATFFRKHGYNNVILQMSNIVSLRRLVAATNYASWQSLSAARNSLRRYHDQLHILEISDLPWPCTAYSVCSKTPTFGERILAEKLNEKIETRTHQKKEVPS